MAERVAAHVYVSGRVQGVYFRATTRDRAAAADVDGWVRNLDDGRVEAHFEGERDAVEELVAYCHEGPEAANVEEVDVQWTAPEAHDGFRIRR